MIEKLGQFSEHIDNGGITVTVFKENDILNISMNTGYLGYPDITSNLKIWSHSHYKDGRNDKQILEDLGKMFIEASNKL